MIPLYKLLSLLLRVFSRPLINLTKRYHANNELKNDWIRRQFFKLGVWFHRFETKINRRYLKMNANNTTVKPISEAQSIDKGIEFFYEILFYSIAIGFPMYQLYRQVTDSKGKDQKLSLRVKKLEGNVNLLSEGAQKVCQKLSNPYKDLDNLLLATNLKYCLLLDFLVN